MKNYNCLDGSMQEDFLIPSADQNVTATEFREDLSAANGEDYSGIIPLVAGALSQTPRGQQIVKGTALDKEVRAERRAARQSRRDQRFQTRMDAKTARNQAKLATAEGLKAAGSDTSTSDALASLGTPATASSTGAKSNTMYYVIGGVVLVGALVYFMTKRGNKN